MLVRGTLSQKEKIRLKDGKQLPTIHSSYVRKQRIEVTSQFLKKTANIAKCRLQRFVKD